MGNNISSIFTKNFGRKEIRILILGPDGAGKTTILYMLKLGEVVTTIPTIGINVETVKYKNINFNMWDMCRKDRMKILMRHYYPNTQGLIFVVDASDRESVADAEEELAHLLREDELKDAVLLVFANKQDIPDAMTTAELTNDLNLNNIKKHSWYVQPTCAVQGKGLYEGLDWLCTMATGCYAMK